MPGGKKKESSSELVWGFEKQNPEALWMGGPLNKAGWLVGEKGVGHKSRGSEEKSPLKSSEQGCLGKEINKAVPSGGWALKKNREAPRK